MRRIRLIVGFCVLMLALPGCEKPQPVDAQTRFATPAPVTPPVVVRHREPGDPPAIVRNQTTEPARPPADILRQYRATSDVDARFVLISELQTAPANVAVPLVGSMLEAEKITDLRVHLFDMLESYEGEVPRKIAIIRGFFERQAQPLEVREAALDALQNIQDPQAIPVWERFLDDPDEDVRDLAKQMISLLRSPGAK